jgi:hypothetical protein
MIEWLWSPEGIAWSHVHIRSVRHGSGIIAEVKPDHECHPESLRCEAFFGYSPYPDSQILLDLKRYGLSGVPVEWKERYERYNRT